MEKICSKCGVSKDVDEFYVRVESKDGRHGQCKQCKVAAQNLWQKTKRGVASHKKAGLKYVRSIGGKLVRSKWRRSSKGEACHKLYSQSPRGKALQKAHNSTSKHKEANRKCKNKNEERI